MSKKNIAYIVISVLITIAFILLAVLVFKTSYIRIFESLTDLIHSIKYYFCKLFGIDAELNPSILDGSNAIKWESVLPSDFNDFKVKFVEFWRLFANLDNFIFYGKTVPQLKNLDCTSLIRCFMHATFHRKTKSNQVGICNKKQRIV